MWALGALAVGHVLVPHAGYLLLAVAAHIVFGFCRAMAGILTKSGIMTFVPRKLLGRTNSTFSLFSTGLQMTMSLMMGELGARYSLAWAFAVLGVMYLAAWTSMRRVTLPFSQTPLVGRLEAPSAE